MKRMPVIRALSPARGAGLVLAIMLGTLLPARLAARTGEAERTVVMEPFLIESSGAYFDCHIYYNTDNDRIFSVRVRWVGPLLKKADLRPGDRLDSIDGKPMEHFLYEEGYQAILGPIKSGQTRTFSFSGYRGLFQKPHLITFVMGRTEPKPATPAMPGG
jgi:hypothetical protein